MYQFLHILLVRENLIDMVLEHAVELLVKEEQQCSLVVGKKPTDKFSVGYVLEIGHLIGSLITFLSVFRLKLIKRATADWRRKDTIFSLPYSLKSSTFTLFLTAN